MRNAIGIVARRKDKKKMASIICCLDMHDDNYLGLSMDHQCLPLEPRHKFKKASAKELKKNAKHAKALKSSLERKRRRRMITIVNCLFNLSFVYYQRKQCTRDSLEYQLNNNTQHVYES